MNRAEIETTVGVARYAPLNAVALLVGSQTGRPGVMTQCAVEERRNLELAIRGLVTYAETLSVYGKSSSALVQMAKPRRKPGRPNFFEKLSM